MQDKNKVISINGTSIVKSQEAILLFILIFILFFFTIDSLYAVTHSRIHFLFLINIIIMLIFMRVLNLRIKMFFFSFIITVLTLLSLYINHTGVGNITVIIWPLSLIVFFGYYKPSENFLKWLFIICKLFIVILTIKATIFYAAGTGAWYQSTDVNVNPNSVGLLLVYLYWISDYSNYGKYGKFKSIFWALIVFCGLFECQSRTSFLAFIITISIKLFLGNSICKNRRNLLFIIGAIILIGVIFPFLYVKAFELNFFVGKQILGKNVFTGRQTIWIKLFDYYRSNPSALLWGSGYNTTFYTSESFNLHNAYLQIYSQFGLVVTFLYIVFILNTIWHSYYNRKLNRFHLSMILYLLTVLIVGIAETTFSYIPMLVFWGLALGLLKNKRIILKDNEP